ncbi:MAG: hypothetical protein R3C56_02205 [Pirellulaceae bacterium]
MVTRVIYLEDSEIELTDTTPETQIVYNVPSSDNALQVADQPALVIIRIGSRVPLDPNGDLREFLYGCPPWIPIDHRLQSSNVVRSGAMA